MSRTVSIPLALFISALAVVGKSNAQSEYDLVKIVTERNVVMHSMLGSYWPLLAIYKGDPVLPKVKYLYHVRSQKFGPSRRISKPLLMSLSRLLKHLRILRNQVKWKLLKSSFNVWRKPVLVVTDSNRHQAENFVLQNNQTKLLVLGSKNA
jgi:hypothetical protein